MGMGFALLAGVFYGSFLTATRWLAGGFRPRFLLISQLLVGSVLLAPLAFAMSAPAMTPWIWMLLVGSAAGSAMGNFLLAMANRSAPASVIAPLVYTQLIAATMLGSGLRRLARCPVAHRAGGDPCLRAFVVAACPALGAFPLQKTFTMARGQATSAP